MSRPESLKIGVLKLAAHPHDRNTYVKLLRKARELTIIKNYWGTRSGMIGSFSLLKGVETEEPVYIGDMCTFVDFDMTKPWMDLCPCSRSCCRDGDIQDELAVR